MTLSETKIIPCTSPPARRLVVVIHGWAMRPWVTMDDVVLAVREELPDADILAPTFSKTYSRRWLAMTLGAISDFATNADPVEIAQAVSDEIEAAHMRREGGYEIITLVGFSLGSLLVRKAYAFGCGHIEDRLRALTAKRMEWVDRVDRIVLLAGTSRGWSMAQRPRHMSRLRYATHRALLWFRKWFPPLWCAGGLILSIERGAPFVANLRLQWLDLAASDTPPPPVVELLGDRDDLVNQEDNVDLQLAAHFKFRRLPNTGHMTALDFHTPGAGERRRELFQAVLQTPVDQMVQDVIPVANLDEDGQVKLGHAKPEDGPDDVTDVIMVVHGIRDYGEWPRKLRDQLPAVLEGAADRRLGRVVAVAPSYPRFSLYDFVFRRRERIRWFVDRYTEIRARYPRARVHFIGHSNGTYLLGRALLDYAAVRFDRVALAGSVLPRAFRWNAMLAQRRVNAVRNDRASGDLVVAIFPRSLESVSEQFPLVSADVGGGGVLGFEQEVGNRFERGYVRGGHGAAVDPKNHRSLIRFVLGIDPTPVYDRDLPLDTDINRWTKFHASMSGLYLLIGAAAVFGAVVAGFALLPVHVAIAGFASAALVGLLLLCFL